MDAPSSAPVRKIVGVGLGGAVATIIIWLITLTGVEFNDGVAAAIVLIVTVVVGYLVPAAPDEHGAQQPAQQQPAPAQGQVEQSQWPGVQTTTSAAAAGTNVTPPPQTTTGTVGMRRSPAPEEKLFSAQPSPPQEPSVEPPIPPREPPPAQNPHPSDQPPSSPPPGVFPPEDDTPAA